MIRFAVIAGQRGWQPLVLLALLGLSLTGCQKSKPAGTVEGTVTLNGEPYDDSALVFLDMQTGQGASVDIQPGGTFRTPDPLPVGTYRVYLAPKSLPPSADPVPVTIDTAVPDKYWSEASTDIEVQVNEGANTAQIELTSDSGS